MANLKPWENDKLDRSRVADLFENIVDKHPSGSVFLVHAEFGMGKTFFVRNWAAQLKNDGRPVVVFDAWSNDFFESPLACFLSILNEEAAALVDAKDTGELKSKIARFGKRAAPIILGTGSRIALRLISMGLIDGDVDRIREVIAEESLKSTEDISGDLAAAFRESAKQNEFRATLHQEFFSLVDFILNARRADKLIVLVDELDRCRPDFALKLLEDIQHFLGVNKVHFFIFCDEDVLQSQAKAIFGDRKSGEKYLSKFYSYRLRLPPVSKLMAMSSFIQEWRQELGNEGIQNEDACNHLAKLLDASSLSIRQSRRVLEFAALAYLMDERLAKVWPLANTIFVMQEIDQNYLEEIIRPDVRAEIGRDFLNPESDDFQSAVNLFFRVMQSDDRASVSHRARKYGDSCAEQSNFLMRQVEAFSSEGIQDAMTAIVNRIRFLGTLV